MVTTLARVVRRSCDKWNEEGYANGYFDTRGKVESDNDDDKILLIVRGITKSRKR